jgi:hypothetical protein
MGQERDMHTHPVSVCEQIEGGEKAMKAPQIIVLTLTGVGLLLDAYMHGKPKEGKNSIWLSLISRALSMGLLWWGGFFNG